ncbi:MAG: DUF2309 domain-containing protein [Planctomycetota bacterium]
MRKLLDLENTTALHSLPLAGGNYDAPLLALQSVIEYSAQMLPAEGPVSAFVFLNALHALEHMPFDEAVIEGAQLFGCQPYFSEDRYRAEVAKRRIRSVDVQAVLEEDLKERAWEPVAGLSARLNLRNTMLRHRVVSVPEEELRWCMAEARAMMRFREETSPNVRKDILADVLRWVVRDLINGQPGGGYVRPAENDPRRQHVLWTLLERFGDMDIDHWSDETWEKFAVQALWTVCQKGVKSIHAPLRLDINGMRPRTLLLDATEVDSDLLVNELLVRFCAAYTDQGFADAALPDRNLGFFKSFCKLYRRRFGPPNRWLRGLEAELGRLDDGNVDPLESIHESLKLLGIGVDEWDEFFPATLLALRGWASMIRQMEVRPDRVYVSAPVGTLTEFLAVRLILERYALAHVARENLAYAGPLADLREVARSHITKSKTPSIAQRTYLVFQLAQLMGWTPSTLNNLSDAQWSHLVAEIEAFGSVQRRCIFHKAFERRLRTRALDAISIHSATKRTNAATPKFQAVFCIDTREEALRRHLEEVCPDVKTYGAPGFFGVAMYYRGIADAQYQALCPIVVRPQHWVTEEVAYSLEQSHRRRASARKAIGTAQHQFRRGSMGSVAGAATSLFGSFAFIPLAGRVLFPRLSAKMRRQAASFVQPPEITRLVLERSTDQPGSEGEAIGFTVTEMADRGERMLRDIGATSNFSRLFFFIAHASHCLNNPHKSAYDCGACTGPGGPGARALASMLNDPRVREILTQRGLPIPSDTIFVGGLHNTATDAVSFFDLDLLPKSHQKEFEEIRDILAVTCERNAHERCRRFDSAPLNIPLAAAHRHVENRSEDIAQVRPEFGNASNAVCFVGRRERIRGLFFDRRCFEHSYDPTQDDAAASKLARILAPVVPVCQGINLTYYFSAIDNNTWGSGTKLPHNVTSLLGVMDGAASDLRQGLPWQSVEIHEPVRLLFVIETTAAIMHKIMDENKIVGRILKNGWAQLAILSPESNEMQLFQDGEFQLYQPEASELPHVESSIDWYRGWRDHLEFAAIVK